MRRQGCIQVDFISSIFVENETKIILSRDSLTNSIFLLAFNTYFDTVQIRFLVIKKKCCFHLHYSKFF